jgi:hypothetical protein
MAAEPDIAWEFLKAVNENGIWLLAGRSGRGGIGVKGFVLTAIWIAEALTILYLTVLLPRDRARRPYSERKGDWMTPVTFPKRVAFIDDIASFNSAISKGDYGALVTPAVRAPDDSAESKYAYVTLYQDILEPFVSVENVAEKFKKKKRKGWSKNVVVKYLKISPSAAQNIKEALS